MAMTANTQARLVDVALPDFGMPVTEPLLPPSIYADRVERLRAAMDERGYDHVVVWGDREHSANIAYLTGFDPRFEEAVLIVGPTNGPASDPAILLGNECYGLGEAAPLADATSPVPGPQLARPVARPIKALARHPERRGRRDRWPDRGRRLEDVLEPGDDRGSGLPRRRAQAVHRPRRPGGERDRPPHRSRRRAPGHQRGRAAGGVRVGRVPDVVRRTQGADRPAARHDRAGMRAAAELERLAAVLPPHAHRRVEGEVRAAEPRRPATRARATRSRSRSGSGEH